MPINIMEIRKHFLPLQCVINLIVKCYTAVVASCTTAIYFPRTESFTERNSQDKNIADVKNRFIYQDC